MTLTVDNQIEPRYYLSSQGSQVVSELIEGKRVYSLEFEIDLADAATDLELFDFMMNQGAASAAGPTLGGVVTISFTSMAEEGGSSELIFNCSGSVSAASPGTVIRGGKISYPAPPAGLFPTTFTMDVDEVAISKT